MGANTQRLAAILKPAVRAMAPPDEMSRKRRVDLAVGEDGRATPYAVSGVLGHNVAQWFISGTLATGNTQGIQYRVPADGVLERFDAIVKTAPTGADLLVRLRQAGHALVTVTIPAGTTSAGIGVNQAVSAGDILTLDITQVGSSVAGSNLSAFATCREERNS